MFGADIIPTVDFDQLDEFLLEFEEHDFTASAGIEVVGDPAAYALVWEWGNRRQKKQGPKTVLGPNPRGEIVWLSTQAPEGWIRRNEDQMMGAFEKELVKATFAQPDAKAMQKELEKRVLAGAEEAAKVLKEYVPVGSGNLRDAIKVVRPGDAILEQEQDDQGALEIIGGGG